MKITVTGTGYVGLVSGACLADLGNEVVCLDIDRSKIQLLNSGVVPIHEPGLQEVIKRNVAPGRLSFTTDVAASVAHGLVQMIAVGTPSDEDGSADLRYVLDAARSVGKHLTDYKVVVNKSTVPVGTADKVKGAIAAELSQRAAQGLKFSVVSNSEFLKEGAAIEDFNRPDRIVIGADDEQAIQILREMYAPFERKHDRLLVVYVKSAELAKYAANAMLATRISFMNELANPADKLGAGIEQLHKGIRLDQRIGYRFFYSGCGYSGSYFPKDARTLKQNATELGTPLKMLQAVENVNHAQKSVLLAKITHRLGDDSTGKNFAFWGLAFKLGTDDMREATSRVVLEGLWARGASVTVYDPVAMPETQCIYGDRPDLRYAQSPHSAPDDADALVIVTEWTALKGPDFSQIRTRLNQPIIFDGRDLLDPAAMQAIGLGYFGIGRGLPTER